MNGVQSVIFRAFSFLLVGVLMVSFPDKVTTWLVRILGVLFIVPGLVSVGSFFRSYTKNDSLRFLLPIIGVGSIILGIILIALPEKFITCLVYFLAAAIILAGVTSIVNIIHFRKYTPVSFRFYVVPVLLCAAGIFIIFIHQPTEQEARTAVNISFVIFGVASIVYGVTELTYAIHFRKIFRLVRNEKKAAQAAAQAENVTEPDETANESVSSTDIFVQIREENEQSPIDFSKDDKDTEE